MIRDEHGLVHLSLTPMPRKIDQVEDEVRLSYNIMKKYLQRVLKVQKHEIDAILDDDDTETNDRWRDLCAAINVDEDGNPLKFYHEALRYLPHLQENWSITNHYSPIRNIESRMADLSFVLSHHVNLRSTHGFWINKRSKPPADVLTLAVLTESDVFEYTRLLAQIFDLSCSNDSAHAVLNGYDQNFRLPMIDDVDNYGNNSGVGAMRVLVDSVRHCITEIQHVYGEICKLTVTSEIRAPHVFHEVLCSSLMQYQHMLLLVHDTVMDEMRKDKPDIWSSLNKVGQKFI